MNDNEEIAMAAALQRQCRILATHLEYMHTFHENLRRMLGRVSKQRQSRNAIAYARAFDASSTCVLCCEKLSLFKRGIKCTFCSYTICQLCRVPDQTTCSLCVSIKKLDSMQTEWQLMCPGNGAHTYGSLKAVLPMVPSCSTSSSETKFDWTRRARLEMTLRALLATCHVRSASDRDSPKELDAEGGLDGVDVWVRVEDDMPASFIGHLSRVLTTANQMAQVHRVGEQFIDHCMTKMNHISTIISEDNAAINSFELLLSTAFTIRVLQLNDYRLSSRNDARDSPSADSDSAMGRSLDRAERYGSPVDDELVVNNWYLKNHTPNGSLRPQSADHIPNALLSHEQVLSTIPSLILQDLDNSTSSSNELSNLPHSTSASPQPSVEVFPPNIACQSGDMVVLNASVTGDAVGRNLTITWHSPLGQVTSTSHQRHCLVANTQYGTTSLHIYDVRPKDAGLYECHVTRGSRRACAEAVLSVQDRDIAGSVPSFSKSLKIKMRGDTFFLTCSVVGHPKPIVRFIINQKPVEFPHVLKVTNFDDWTLSTDLMNIAKGSYITATCSNRMGQATSAIQNDESNQNQREMSYSDDESVI